MEPARAGFLKILRDILRRSPPEDAALIAWRIVCGPTVGCRTVALDLREGVLRVEVPDTSWQANLQAFIPQYLDSLNSMLNERVRRILFVLPEDTREKARKSA